MNKLQVCVMHRHGPGESCGAKGSKELLGHLQQRVKDIGLNYAVEPINCLLYCQKGPNVKCLSSGKIWHQVGEEVCEEILRKLQQE